MGQFKTSFAIRKAADMLDMAENIVVFTGAGVSTESGIPDFRSQDGIWGRYDPNEFTYERFMYSDYAKKKHWEMLGDFFFNYDFKPNAAHEAIARLEIDKKLLGVITQNIDGLHQAAGVSQNKIYEIHGSLRCAYCLKCGKYFNIESIKESLLEGKNEIPECDQCGGYLKPDVIFFGEKLPTKTLEKTFSISEKCDLFVVIGSSLSVYPAAGIPKIALDSGAKLIIINMSSTYLDEKADIVINGKAGDIMLQLIDAWENN